MRSRMIRKNGVMVRVFYDPKTQNICDECGAVVQKCAAKSVFERSTRKTVCPDCAVAAAMRIETADPVDPVLPEDKCTAHLIKMEMTAMHKYLESERKAA